MFAECLLETSWAQRAQRSWTTFTSFGLQVVVIGALLIIPLWKTLGPPEGRVLPMPLSWGEAPPPASVAVHRAITAQNQSNFAGSILIAPREIPTIVKDIDEEVPPPQVSYNDVMGVEGATGPAGSREGIWKSISDSLRRVAPVRADPSTTLTRTFRTSNMLQGSLIRRVEPVYPPLARTARIQGAVVLAAVISKTGTIEQLQVLSGHPVLVNAALQAVSQWRYRPYVLNGELIEVETQITVNFKLN